MQQRITLDVRIVFRLLVSNITECLPGKSYIIQIKRGDKIKFSSEVLTADEKGVVYVGLKRTFTSTFQRQTDWKYKHKELRFSITEVHTQKVSRLCYDLRKGMDGDSFPERRVIMKGRDGSPQLYFELEGTEEARYNQEHGIESAVNASFSSYMRESSRESFFGQTGILEGCRDNSVESCVTLNEFESVVESITEASSAARSEDVQFEENRTNKQEYGINTSEERISPSHGDLYRGQNLSSIAPETRATMFSGQYENTLETPHQEVLKPDVLKGKESRPPPRVPARRIVVSSSSSHLVLEAVRRVHDAVKSDPSTTENSQFPRDTPTGAQLTLSYYLKWDGELLKHFILHFVAHIVTEVCTETRHLGDWLDLLTHVMYRSILDAHSELSYSSIQEVVLQLAKMSRLNDKTFVSRGTQIIEELAESLSSSAASELFWISGLEYCAVTLASLPTLRLERMCHEFPMILPFSEEASFSFEEHIVAATTMLFAELSSIMSSLHPTARAAEPNAVYTTPPLYRIVLVALVKGFFSRIVATIIKSMYNHQWNDESAGPYMALRILKLSKSWAKKNRLLSALSTSLMSLIVYCDCVLFPDELLQGDYYNYLMIRFLPHEDIGNLTELKRCNSQLKLETILAGLETQDTFSLFNTLVEFTPTRCVVESEVESGMRGLLEILNGDEGEAKQIAAVEEFFHGTEFNGVKNTLYNPEMVLQFLRNEVIDDLGDKVPPPIGS